MQAEEHSIQFLSKSQHDYIVSKIEVSSLEKLYKEIKTMLKEFDGHIPDDLIVSVWGRNFNFSHKNKYL